MKKAVNIKRLIDPSARLDSERRVGHAERAGAGGAAPPRRRIESIGSDGKLFISAERNSVLHSAHRVQLRIERSDVSEHEARFRGEAEHELHPRTQLTCATHRAERGVPAPLEIILRLSTGPAEDAAVQLASDIGHRSAGGKWQTDAGITHDAGAEGGAGTCRTLKPLLDSGGALAEGVRLEGEEGENPGEWGAREGKPRLE